MSFLATAAVITGGAALIGGVIKGISGGKEKRKAKEKQRKKQVTQPTIEIFLTSFNIASNCNTCSCKQRCYFKFSCHITLC